MTARQLKDLTRALAHKSGIEARYIMTNVMLERFLERVSHSKYRYNFILKGGMLIAAMVGVELRSTLDMDATIAHLPVTAESLREIVEEIIAIPLLDGVAFRVTRVQSIREDSEYDCLRFAIEAQLERSVIPIHIDISAGDLITPREIQYRFKLLLEDREIEVMAYNLETVLAEKMMSMLARKETNTRMRDFYDVYVLTKLQSDNISPDILAQALLRTATQRGELAALQDAQTMLVQVRQSDYMYGLWAEYGKRYPYARDISFDETLTSVADLLSKCTEFVAYDKQYGISQYE